MISEDRRDWACGEFGSSSYILRASSGLSCKLFEDFFVVFFAIPLLSVFFTFVEGMVFDTIFRFGRTGQG